MGILNRVSSLGSFAGEGQFSSTCNTGAGAKAGSVIESLNRQVHGSDVVVGTSSALPSNDE